MRLLVTGGCGFIGSNYIRYTLENHPKYTIVNLDKLTYAGTKERLKCIKDNPNYTLVVADINDRRKVDKIMPKVDAVVHFAAESHVDLSIKDPRIFFETNTLGTLNLVESAVKHGVVFHHISTDEVFGSIDRGRFDEESPLKPRNPYSASKAAAEHIINSYANTYGLKATITAMSNNFGPWQHNEKFIPHSITNLLQSKKIQLYGDGGNIREWLYVEDCCSAIDLIVHKGRMGEKYCVAGPCKKTNLEVAETIIKMMGKDSSFIKRVKDRPGHDQRYAMNSNKIKKELGWKPKNDFKPALQKTINWYTEKRRWWEKLKH